MQSSRRARRVAVLALLVSLFGATGVATAASSSAVPVATGATHFVAAASGQSAVGPSSATVPSLVGSSAAGATSAVVRTEIPAKDGRASPKPIIDAAVRLIKSIPGWWSKFVSGVKKAYSWFVANVWKPLVKIINVLATLVGAWEIWNFFH